MEPKPRQIFVYCTVQGQLPYLRWAQSLRDFEGLAAIARRIKRLKQGNLGDCKRFGPITELRVDTGPGYRVYFGQEGTTLVLLLCGGDKSSQTKDFESARRYWDDYQKRGEQARRSL